MMGRTQWIKRQKQERNLKCFGCYDWHKNNIDIILCSEQKIRNMIEYEQEILYKTIYICKGF